MDTLLDFIRDLGFPIFVAVYMLIDSNKKQEEMRKSIDRNTEVINDIKDYIKGSDRT